MTYDSHFMQGRICQNFAIFVFFHLLLYGCGQYKYQTKDPSSLYKIIPRHRNQIKRHDIGHWATWAIFGNDDEGIFGEGANHPYKPRKANNGYKALNWWLRNPFHNLLHYGIGTANKQNSEFVFLNLNKHRIEILRYRPIAQLNYGRECSSLLLALHGGKPFASFRLRYNKTYTSDFYVGWRKNGAFGMKANPIKKNCSNSFL